MVDAEPEVVAAGCRTTNAGVRSRNNVRNPNSGDGEEEQRWGEGVVHARVTVSVILALRPYFGERCARFSGSSPGCGNGAEVPFQDMQHVHTAR
jgi:hypothetical protein